MSALSMIRHNMTLIVILIALALLAFILTDLFTGLSTVLSAPPDAGVVAGEAITYREYEDRVASAASQQPGTSQELTRGRVADQVWDVMVSEIIWDKELERAGMEVSGEELYDMFAGREVSPIVRNYLLPPGQPYDQNTMKRQLEQIMENPDQSQQLKLLEDYAARTRGIDKYITMVRAGYLGSQAAARQKNINQNRKVDITYLSIPYSSYTDSVPVSDGELKAYINNHKEEFKQEAETYIRFAKFEVKPSKKDSIKARNELMKDKQRFADASNDSTFTANKSRLPFSGDYEAVSDLPADIQSEVLNAEDKAILGPFQSGGYYKLYKLVGTETAEEPSSSIAHILINHQTDTASVRNQVADLVSQVRGGADFAELASVNSQDFGSRANGGELGWYRKGQFGEDFDKAVNAAPVGSIIGPVKSSRGFHVVKILDRTTKNFAVAEIEEAITYSTDTRDSLYRLANQFAAKANQSNINTVADEMSVVAFESNPITDETRDILGLNGGREVALWALESPVGAKSKVIRVNDNYVYAEVTRKLDEGVKSINDPATRAAVEVAVKNQKVAKIIKDKLSSAGQDLNAMKAAYGDGATIGNAPGISFESISVAGIGAEPKVIGKASGMSQGETSGIIEGNNGVYVIQVTNVTEAPELDAATLANNSKSDAAIQAQGLQSKAEPALIDISDVEDNRAKAEAVMRYGIR